MWFLQVYLALAQVELNIETLWKGHSPQSLSAEVAECVWDIDHSIYWKLFDEGTEKWENLLPNLLVNLCWDSIWNRQYAARMEFFSKIEYNNPGCKTYFVIDSTPTCELEEVLLNYSRQTERYTKDHVYREGESVVVFYTDYSSSSRSDHEKAVEFSQAFNCTYVVRPVDTRLSGPDYLGGFGGYLLLKNMDYKPVEDTSIVSETEKGDWNFNSKKYLDLPEKLITFLLEKNEIWEVVEVMRTLPSNGKIIKEIPIERGFFDSLISLDSRMIGENILLINGHPISIDFFNILETLKIEGATLQELVVNLGIQRETALEMLVLSNIFAHEYIPYPSILETGPHTGRVYINDLANDEEYMKWSPNIMNFIYDYMNEFTKVRLNLFNLIGVVDLSTEEGWKGFFELIELYELENPLRIGFVFLGEDLQVTEMIQALKFIKKLSKSQKTEFYREIREKDIKKALEKVCKECELDEGISSHYERPRAFCLNTNVCGPFSLLLNGKLVQMTQGPDLLTKIEPELEREKEKISYLQFMQVLDPSTEFFEFPSYMETSERINEAITDENTNKLKLEKPKEGGWLLNREGLVTFTIPVDEAAVLDLSLETLYRYSHLPINFRFYIEFTEITEEFQNSLCHLNNLMQGHEVSSIKNECFSDINELNKFNIGIPEQNRGKILVNSRRIDFKHFNSPIDFHIAFKTEEKRMNLDKLSILFPSENRSFFIEEFSYIVLKHIKRLPEFYVYSSYPISNKLYESPLSKKYVANNPNFEVEALVNPLSETGQKLIEILKYLEDYQADILMIYNPDLTEKGPFLPTHRYYKLHIKKSFSDELLIGEPSSSVYTLGLDTDKSWVIRAKESPYDPDNIIPKEKVEIDFILKNILIEGSCAHSIEGEEVAPPAGLQLKLNTGQDTIVMEQQGYFEFFSNPGVYSVELNPGRSKEVFSFTEENLDFEVSELRSTPLFLSVQKNPGYETVELLGTLNETWYGDTIHVFGLASGELYERLIKIMIVSVMAHTNEKIKFWLLYNFFSDSFTKEIHLLSEELEFEYEFVTYKWPSWLLQQKEKQRIIWGYKILFLDVLFPLSVKKIIYIDADQVVRADIKELWEMDLQGAPYAYTPFCDSNPDTQEFMFWKQGYWKDLLGEKPYHISALYVVDLLTFRSIGAGDILRYLYSTLGSNPDSLANLDEDLPNFAEIHIPIFPLPQEWLWCATWCLEENKEKAKSIDLCNNPLTKEPKIKAASRIIEEWDRYDKAVKDFEEFGKRIKIKDPPREDL